MAGVVNTQSPRERRRISSTFAPLGNWESKRLVLHARFVDEHNGNVVTDGVDAFALHALEAAAIGFKVERCLAKRADEDLQQILGDGHWSYFSAQGRRAPW